MNLFIIIASLMVRATLASDSYSSVDNNAGRWQGISGPSAQNLGPSGSDHIMDSYGNAQQDVTYGSYGASDLGGSGYGGGISIGHGDGHEQHHYAHAVPISQHIEVTNPVAVPVYKDIGVPVAQPVAIPVPQPVIIGVAQPYPVHVPVAQPVAVPVVRTVAVPIEKKVPYPVEKIVPVPVEKLIPVPVEKHIPVPVEKPYPIRIPIYKHVFHRTKSHGHGWSQ